MNNKLKSQIVLLFGTQGDFAVAVGAREDRVSRVIRGRDQLSSNEQQRWASILKAEEKELFDERK
ncbi:MAG TPA: XRE family transcriptional regulator [Syntrophus sp. (in: bacteria)]|nr:XRE family transcriptional regulator [Syntrophus sp. (in: bacteria)]